MIELLHGKNPKNEAILLNSIRHTKGFRLEEQPKAQSGKNPAFYHVMKGANKKAVNRLYLNCKRENVALLANELIKEMKDIDSYYFKFNSDNQMQTKCRPEKFVFYVSEDPKELNSIVTAIKNVQSRSPELFKGSEAVSPFLNVLDGNIMFANEVKDGFYNMLSGKRLPIAPSYNSLLSAALDDSYLQTISDIVAKDYSLSMKTGGERYTDSTAYTLLALEEVMQDPVKKEQLIKGMGEKLKDCMKRNPTLQIKGIDGKNNDSRMRMQDTGT